MNQRIYSIFKAQEGQVIDNGPSKAANWLALKLLRIGDSNVTMEGRVREDMCNPVGILHGGIASLMLDEIIGIGNIVMTEEYVMSSVNLNVDFLSSANIGERLIISAKLIRLGANLNHWEAKIEKESGKLVAKASSNMSKTHIKLSDLGL
ncbi:PaaI family thioesterase [Algoriphagus sediminis]|uniref:PaaI family thioesterase n=1 Tax=Algoriphagus sediminis TaxID=3057113 RepID=A0ABT7YBT8_9BACT|nr:PaaI family thioesterase [Algoriphagus sediminis]MDN3203967.1 PaaI family thioesterase [Algoriphagus sediminis]